MFGGPCTGGNSHRGGGAMGIKQIACCYKFIADYIKSIAQSRYQKDQKAISEKYEPQETDVEALYQIGHLNPRDNL